MFYTIDLDPKGLIGGPTLSVVLFVRRDLTYQRVITLSLGGAYARHRAVRSHRSLSSYAPQNPAVLYLEIDTVKSGIESCRGSSAQT